MDSAKRSRRDLRDRKKLRSKIVGTAERPRLTVFRSARHMMIQVVDDSTHRTLVAVGTIGKEYTKRPDKEACKLLGQEVAKACLNNKIEKVVFDKNGFIYHGRVAAVADGAREGGLKF